MRKVDFRYYHKIFLFVFIGFISICGVRIHAQVISKSSTQKLFTRSNKKLNDSLTVLIKNGKIKSLSFQEHLAIQKQYDKLDKKIRIIFAEAFLNRQDLMQIDTQKAEAYLRVGVNFQFMGDDFEKAKLYLDESLVLYKKAGNIKKEAEAMRNLAIYHHSKDEDSIAVKFYTNSQELAEKINDTIGIIRPYGGLTFMYTKIGLYEKAIQYGLEGIKRAEFYKENTSIAHISNNLGNAFLKKGDYLQALKMYQRALSINKDTENIIRNCSNIGNAFLHINKIDSAAYYLNRVEQLLPEVDVPRVYIFAYSYLAKLRNKQKKFNEARAFAKKAVDYSQTYQLESISEEAHLALVESYKKMNNSEEALKAYENYWEIKKNFLETSRNKTVAQIEQQFQKYKKEKEIEIKAAEIAILKKDQIINSRLRNVALLVVLLLASLVYLFYNRFIIKKKTTEKLSTKNKEIEHQKELIQNSLSEKETLLREIHHRVKNNLQIISSLLNIQSAQISDENVLASIHEGQSRVQAMSLIHQNLYQSDHLNNVDIENYLRQLTDYLAGMFGKNNAELTTTVKAKGIHFDIDTAIPLGLIVNELVSNAYKYAFENHDSGTIKLTINQLSEVDFELMVADNGKGLPENFMVGEGQSLGLKLVKILSRQLRGSLSFYEEHGTVFVVKFKDLSKYNAIL